ncbi:MAG: hypothetical protein IJN25_07890 [Clostridia bacterium]|nr:hypothetical protein [Clostridia bacterium]
MKFGVRKPSIKRSIKARTTGKIKRSIKKSVNPLYGKKGMGIITDPKKAVYNKVYNKTTIGVKDIIDMPKSKSSKNSGYSYKTTNSSTQKETSIERKQPTPKTPKKNYSAKTHNLAGILCAIDGWLLILLGLCLLPMGIIFIIIGVFLLFVSKAQRKMAREKKQAESTASNIDIPEDKSTQVENVVTTNDENNHIEENAEDTSVKENNSTCEVVENNDNTISSVSFDTVLVYNGTEKMQWEIRQVHKGDKIDIEIDDDDRYLVSTKDSYDIGYLHKRISDKIDALLNEDYEVADGEITDIAENSGKYSVEVHIVLENRKDLL